MRGVKFALLLSAMAGLSSMGLASAVSAQTSAVVVAERNLGVWRNPKDSVHVEIKSCGTSTCGYVIWANADAQADARKGGTQNLVGLQLLRDFTPGKNNTWKGKVFVPDLNMTFSGTAQFIDAKTMKAKGCLLPNFLCKSQTWTRVDIAAN